MENTYEQVSSQGNYQPQEPLPNATASLVLGIVSIVGCFCYGIVGIICGAIGLSMANKGLKLFGSDPDKYTKDSYNNVKTGRICAIIGLILSILYIVILIVVIAIYGFVIFKHPEMIRDLNNH